MCRLAKDRKEDEETYDDAAYESADARGDTKVRKTGLRTHENFVFIFGCNPGAGVRA